MNPSYFSELYQIKDFGVYSETVSKFSELTALELYHNGTIDIPGLDPDVEYDENSQKFKEALSKTINLFQSRIIESIERGQLKPTWLTRDIDTGRIDPDETLIFYSDLIKVLEEFGFRGNPIEHELGEFMWAETDLSTKLTEIVKLKRLVTDKIDPIEISREAEKAANNEGFYTQLVTEVIQLRLNAARDKPSREIETEKPLTKRERNTLLIIIAALANQLHLDISKTAKTGALISSYADLIGIPVDHSTIENKLKDIPALLADRRG